MGLVPYDLELGDLYPEEARPKWQTQVQKPIEDTLAEGFAMMLAQATGLRKVNPAGGSGGEARGTWCTPEWLAELIGQVHLDPCSNARSHMTAALKLSLELGDDGLDIGEGGPGGWRMAVAGGISDPADFVHSHADDKTITYINPPFTRGEVIKWVEHYKHTRFIFCLRWAPDTRWFKTLIAECDYVWFPGKRIQFEPPPGVVASNNPFPHALYLRDPAADLLARLSATGYLLPVDTGARAAHRNKHVASAEGVQSHRPSPPSPQPGGEPEDGNAGAPRSRGCLNPAGLYQRECVCADCLWFYSRSPDHRAPTADHGERDAS